MGVLFVRPGELDLLQQRKVLIRFAQSIIGQPVAQQRSGLGVNRVDGNTPTPQPFKAMARIQNVDPAAVGVDTGWPSLPGRMPLMTLDGEPGGPSVAGGAY